MKRLVAVILVVLACGLGFWLAHAKKRQDALPVRPSEVTQVVWFAGKEKHGLRQDSSGDLFVGSRRLALDETRAKLYAAACYLGAQALVTVDANAVTRLYERRGDSLVLNQTKEPGARVWTCGAGFCNVPGLVYLTTTSQDPNPSGCISNMKQVQTVFTNRIALGSRATDWHAVQTEPMGVWPSSSFMHCTYEMTSPRLLRVYLPDARQAAVHLSDQLVPPTTYQNIEPVTVALGRAIICRTRKGWSMYDIRGHLVRFFPVGQRGHDAVLGNPFYARGYFYVPQSFPQSHVEYYRMDIPTGKLVDVGQNYPR